MWVINYKRFTSGFYCTKTREKTQGDKIFIACRPGVIEKRQTHGKIFSHQAHSRKIFVKF